MGGQLRDANGSLDAGHTFHENVTDEDVRSDLTSGFKCFRRRVLENIDLDSIHSEGYSFQIELTYRAMRLGFRVAEVPIVFVDRRAGQSKMSFRIFLEAMGVVWRLRLQAA